MCAMHEKRILFVDFSMSQAHYEAVRLLSQRPQTMGSSRRCLLPVRLWPAPEPPEPKISRRFKIPNEEPNKQVTHQHILSIGDRLLLTMQRNIDRRIQQTYEQLVEAERSRLENEYRQKTDEINRQWKVQLEEEKLNLRKEFDEILADMERIRHQRNRTEGEEEEAIRRVKNECERALARQWKIAQLQLSQAVVQAEDRLRAVLELKFLEEKERFTRELVATKDVEYAERELKVLEKLKADLTLEHSRDMTTINEAHKQEIAELNNKLKLTEERFRREFSLRARLESDFRLLQTDYKRFMDHTNVFHSDYMLKLHHIGEQIGDAKFEHVLDRIMTDLNIQQIAPKTIKTQVHKSKHALKLPETKN